VREREGMGKSERERERVGTIDKEKNIYCT